MSRPLLEKRGMVNRSDSVLSIKRQSEILGIHRSGLYYEPAEESALNLELMRMMDEHYLLHPYKGARRMHTWLTLDEGYEISLNRIERLYYKVMGLRAVFPGPHTSKRRKDHAIYPYLLRELEITRPNQVWATDITYLPMPVGYMYLVAIIDLYSRFVVNWSLSNTMLAEWCAECFRGAMSLYGKPDIFNTDQGSQFTSGEFTGTILGADVKLSMDGKGRATDNAFIECLWKMVKYEDVYVKEYRTTSQLYSGLEIYFDKYNFNRRHSSIGNDFPAEWFFFNPEIAV